MKCIKIQELSDRIKGRFEDSEKPLPTQYYFARFKLPSELIVNIYNSKEIDFQGNTNPNKSEITIIKNMIKDINSSYFNSIKRAS